MYDSTTINVTPAEPHAVAAYVNGEFANYDEAKRLFPNARILTISVTGLVAADAYDVEKGDYIPNDVPELYKFAVEHGVWRPCFYGSLDVAMPHIKSELNTVVQAREDVRLWVAYYNGHPDLPSEYDAHQFTDKALGRNLDESICNSTFFQAVKPKQPVVANPASVVSEWWTSTIPVKVHVGTSGPAKGEWQVEVGTVEPGNPVTQKS